MKRTFIWYIAILSLLVNACGSGPQGTALRDDDTLTTAPAPERTALRDDDNINTYNKALNQANSAANLAQKAKSETEWKAVASEWNKAIATLKSVPKNDANYALAQQKIAEYQKNLNEAQKKTKVSK